MLLCNEIHVKMDNIFVTSPPAGEERGNILQKQSDNTIFFGKSAVACALPTRAMAAMVQQTWMVQRPRGEKRRKR